MQTKRLLALLLVLAMFLGLLPGMALAAGGDGDTPVPIYEDTSYSFAERAADLVARMTLSQKGSQMISDTASAIPAEQLGGGALNVPATKDISAYRWWSEALHGYSKGTGSSNSVSYPQNLSAGSTWNPDLYYRQAVQISDEIRERTSTNGLGNAIDLCFYSPTINMQRDPRWGRNEEAFSEDVLLNSVMGAQFVLGMEGKDQEGNLLDPDGYLKALTTIKHYTANNSERNRLDGGATTDLRALREYYTAPYRNVIKAADVASVMTAYSTVNGEPASMSSYLMDTLLRQTWGFGGYITSDCDSVSTIARHKYVNPHTGEVLTSIEQLSQAMAHGEDLECSGGYNSGVGTYASNISAMVSAGVDTDKGVFTENQVDVSLHRLMTARISTGEFDDNLAYTEAAAERKAAQAEAGGAAPNQTPERLEAAEAMANEAVVMLKNNGILPLQVEGKEDYSIAIVGAWQTDMYLGVYTSGQSITENHINIQQGIANAIQKINPDVAFDYITSNTLTAEDEAVIRNADAVIVVVGTNSSYSAEDRDRTTIILPNNQAELISQVGGLNENTIAVMETCGPMQVTAFEDDVAAILWSSFSGIRKVGFGNVISGAVNPSGKVTATWHQNVNDNGDSDIPSIYNYNLYATNGDSGRTYMYYEGENDPSYPFGYGMSYTTFEYSNLKLDESEYDANDTIIVTFDVQNTGDVTGMEVVQLYVAQPDAPDELNRPIKRLEGFDKIELAPNQKETVTLKVSIPDLAYFNESEMRYEVDTGRYQIQVGPNSRDIAMTQDLTVTGAMNVYPEVLTAKPNQDGDTALGIEERLIFDKGKEVHPQLTLAMNDESLYGYIIANQQSPIYKMGNNVAFPEGTKITYVSNRPEVVEVDGDTITTVNPGVATITATLELNGVSVSTDFVVYVESNPYLDSITVNGTPIEGFRSDRMNYTVESADETVPEIGYTAGNPDLDVTVQKADSYPGVTTITVTNRETNASEVYRIGFGKAPVTTSFADSSKEALAAAGWTVLNADDTNAAFGTDGLTITTQQGVLGSTETPAKNVYMTPAVGEWVAQSHISLDSDLNTLGQQIGLVAYDDADHYVSLVYERAMVSSGWWQQTEGTVIRAYAVSDGEQTQIGSATITATDLYFQIVKRGDGFSFNYSTDGTSWTSFGGSTNVYMAYPQIGTLAVNGTSADAQAVKATFDGVSIFEVDDLYPRLKSITVDGQPLVGFDAEKFIYNQEVTESAKTPVIAAEPANEAHTVTIQQLDGATGTATVTVSSGAASQTYSLSYNYGPVSDYFADGELNADRWEILKEDAEAYDIVKGTGIVMPTQRGDIHSTGGDWYNAFVTPAMGNWEVVAKVVYPHVPTANYQQAMLLVWQDEDNYIRVNCQQDSLRLEPGVEINGSFAASGLNQAYAEADEDGTVTLYFKIKKDGLNYTAWYSQNGTDYNELGTVQNIDFSNPRIGLFATQNSSSEQMDVYFEYLTVTNLNGVEQISYADMLRQATQNVADYVAADIPATASDDIVFAAVPHGYTLKIDSGNPGVIASDGTVTRGAAEQKVNLTVTVSDATTSVTSDPIEVTVPASDGPAAVSAVTATPKAGAYARAQSVTLSTATEGTKIYYTTDGTEPTAESTLYTGPISVAEDMTIQAIAVKEGLDNSPVATFVYDISTSTDVDDAEEPDDGETGYDVDPLWKEYEGYFKMGTFGNFNAGDWEYHGNVSSPANALKLDSQIGNSNTNSLSRQQYLETVEAIEADTEMTDEEKEAALQEANETVVLDSGRQASGLRMLEEIRQWNEDHPDEEPKVVRGHVLAWHGGQQPNYFFCEGFYYDSSKTLAEQAVDEETMLARLDNYIRQMMEVYSEYSDIIVAWDVVNEAIDDYTGQIRNAEGYQVGQWGTVFRHEELDDDLDARLEAESAWVRQAFASARKWSDEYGCDWKLYYNDFQDSNKLYEPKMSQTIKMLEPIYAAGNIDGYGMQGRLSYAYPTIEMLREQIELGLTVADEISFTESDIRSDFIPNPNYDPDEPTRRVQEGDPEWPENSGSFKNISSDNGNTFDVHNSPVMRDPEWGVGANYDLAASEEKMKAQADFAADLMDLLIEYAKDGQVAVYQWDGTTDSGTFNRTTGCTMWDSNGNEKYSFYAVAGAPNRDKLQTAIDAAPTDSTGYTADSWAKFEAALAAAEGIVDDRIYTKEDLDACKNALTDLNAAIDGLRSTNAQSASFLEKGNADNVSIINQHASRIVPGKGLLLTDTRGSIMGADNSPVDLVTAPAAGDWTATVKLDFDGGSRLGYYEYFGFVAMQDYDNHVGFQVGDGGVYLNLEKDGVTTALDSANGSTKIADVQYYRIEKSGDDYTFYYSADGKEFTKTGEALDTGLNDVELAFDAYCTNQWSGKTMYVEYLHVSDAASTESMSEFALNAALEYLVGAVGDQVVFPVDSSTMQLPTLDGYTVTFISDNQEIVSESGLVTAPETARTVGVKIRVSDGVNEAVSDRIELTIDGMAFRIAGVTFDPESLSQTTGDMTATVVIENTSGTAQKSMMIAALYDPEGRMVNYGSVGKSVAGGATEKFEARFRVPFDSDNYQGYVVKVFVWDGDGMNTTNMIPLSGVTILDK